jgi:hypothetical protein
MEMGMEARLMVPAARGNAVPTGARGGGWLGDAEGDAAGVSETGTKRKAGRGGGGAGAVRDRKPKRQASGADGSGVGENTAGDVPRHAAAMGEASLRQAAAPSSSAHQVCEIDTASPMIKEPYMSHKRDLLRHLVQAPAVMGGAGGKQVQHGAWQESDVWCSQFFAGEEGGGAGGNVGGGGAAPGRGGVGGSGEVAAVARNGAGVGADMTFSFLNGAEDGDLDNLEDGVCSVVGAASAGAAAEGNCS